MKTTMKMVVAMMFGVALLVGVMGTETKAATLTKEELNVYAAELELEEDLKEGFTEYSEAFRRAISYDIYSEEMSGDIWDIEVDFTFYKKYTYEVHFIYDAREDDMLTEYGVIDGVRVDDDEFEDIVEQKFPELFV